MHSTMRSDGRSPNWPVTTTPSSSTVRLSHAAHSKTASNINDVRNIVILRSLIRLAMADTYRPGA